MSAEPDFSSIVRAGSVRQVASVVADLEASVRSYWQHLGIGPWTAYTLDSANLHDVTYEGGPGVFTARHALAWKGDVQFELVEPLSGDSVWNDHLQQHGEGLHHVGMYVDDHPGAVLQLQRLGFRLVQSARGFGATGDGAFAYFDTGGALATMLEVIEAPSVRRPPAFVYPAEDAEAARA